MSKIYEYSYDDYINAQKALTNSKFGNIVYDPQ